MPTKTAILKELRKDRQHQINVRLGILGLIIGGFAAMFALGQVWYAHRAALNNHPNVKVQPRMVKPFGPHQKVAVVALLKNFGTDDAHNLLSNSVLMLDYFKTDDDAAAAAGLLFKSHQPETPATLAPGEEIQQLLVTPRPLEPDDYEMVMNGKLKIYLFSDITYFDSAGKKYPLRACQYFSPQTSRMTLCDSHSSQN
jgi:hypothetical protein